MEMGSGMYATAVLDEKVLVLNRLYTAVRVISARRAFVMLFKQAAEVIAVENGRYANYDFDSWVEIAQLQRQFEPHAYSWVRTARIEIAVPKIIRLLAYDRLPKQQVKLNRRNIYARDGNRCQYCGKHFKTRELTIDHVVPRVQGGEHTWRNLVCACVACNTRKGGRTPRQAHMRLVRPPVEPRRNPAITLRLGSAKYQSWRAFLSDAYWTVELRD
jgi:5-methylcytosine-specific restriction endonuclease McrA